MTKQEFDETNWTPSTVVTQHDAPDVQLAVLQVNFRHRCVWTQDNILCYYDHIDKVFPNKLVAMAYSG